MKNYTYNFEVKTMMEQFVAAFNDIVIKGYDENSDLIPDSDKNVTFVYAPKQRVYTSLNTPGPGAMTTPIIAVSLGGLSRDKGRVFNKNQGFLIPYNDLKSEQFLKRIPQPIPVNITVNMTIVTKYQEHLDQIIANFVPYCDPYVIISWKFPGLSESDTQFEIRSEVLWSGQINPTYPTELSANASYKVSADTSFTIKGWIFKKFDEPFKKIFFIDSSYTPFNFKNQSYKKLLSDLSVLETDYFYTSAKPFLKTVYPSNCFISDVSSTTFDLYGKYLIKPECVYLSASNPLMFENVKTFSPFISSEKLSGIYTPFNGISCENFTSLSDYYLQFEFPQIPKTAGTVDIIVQNEAGYHNLRSSSTTNALSGIKIN